MPNYHAANTVMNPTRFPGGLNTCNVTDAMAQLGMLDPSRIQNFFSDFITYTAADWTVTKVGAGTNALTTGAGGWLLITNAAADNDSVFHQLPSPAFSLSANKRAFFKCRFKVSDATQSDIQFGLLSTDTTPFDVTDGIYMLKPDDAATVNVICRKDATTGSISGTAVATLVSDTFVTFGWAYDGKASVEFYFDDVKVYTLDASSTYLPDTLLTPSFGLQNGEAVAKNMTVDYIFAAVER